MFDQISVWLPNNPGVLNEFLNELMENNIQIRAITVAENDEYGLILLLVDKPKELYEYLEDKGYLVSSTKVLAVKIKADDKTKGLKEIAHILGSNNINIEFLYSTLVKDQSLVIIRVDDNEKAKTILKKNSFLLEEREAI